MASSVKPVPEGQRTLTPHIVVKGGAKAIEFYTKAFGATEFMRMACPQTGAIMHAEMRIGDSVLFLAEEFSQCAVSPTTLGGTPVTLHLYVEDADATYQSAVEAGATAAMPLANMPWGDRYGQVVDPFGHKWSIATHIEDVTPEECMARMASMFGNKGEAPAEVAEPAGVA